MNSPKLVIFDCDGVLVDSETIGNRAISEEAAVYGLSITPEDSIRTFRGLKMAEVVETLEQMLGRTLPSHFVPDLRARMAVLFQSHLQAIPGIEPLLDGLSVPFCTASNAPHEKIRITLGVTGLLRRFEGRIFSAYDVNIWKPDPGLYLYAAQQMGHAAAECVVVEDSAPGVEAAVAAGMRVYGFASEPESGDASQLRDRGATLFHSMQELAKILPSRW